MPKIPGFGLVLCRLFGIATMAAAGLLAAQPTVKEALSLRPIQADVDYDIPDAKTYEQCKIALVKEGKATGWAVTGPAGQTLRRFMDIDGVKDAKGETTVDEAEAPTVDEKRAVVHERGQAAARDMRDSTKSED